jgi:hypothetical protein
MTNQTVNVLYQTVPNRQMLLTGIDYANISLKALCCAITLAMLIKVQLGWISKRRFSKIMTYLLSYSLFVQCLQFTYYITDVPLYLDAANTVLLNALTILITIIDMVIFE